MKFSEQFMLDLDKTSAKVYTPPKVLECSTKGDKRFSALCARVEVFGRTDTIENWYQLSKRFEDGSIPKTWKDAKGKKPTHFHVNGVDYPMEYFSMWYKLLWVRYLGSNPSLVEYASQFDDYNDIFKGNSVNCQADVIRQYIKQGKQSLLDECQPLISAMAPVKEPNPIKTACFTGHRPDKLGTGYSITSPAIKAYSDMLRPVIVDLIENHGVKRFISGGALGIDQIAFWTVHRLQREGYEMDNVLSIPFRNQHIVWRRDELIQWYHAMVQRADRVTYVDELPDYHTGENAPVGDYTAMKMELRNHHMVDNSDYVIAVWDGGTSGGTYNCVKYAREQQKDIIQLEPIDPTGRTR